MTDWVCLGRKARDGTEKATAGNLDRRVIRHTVQDFSVKQKSATCRKRFTVLREKKYSTE
jgi:hypothetical protein